MISVKELIYKRNKRLILNIEKININTGINTIILGKNGAGKTSLFDCFINFLNYQGSITLNSINIKNLPQETISEYVAYVTANFHSTFQFTVKEYLELSLNNKKNNQVDIQSIIEELELEPIVNTSTLELSSGEQKRIQIAKAMCQNTPIILMDEPSNHLDPKQKQIFIKAVKKIKNKTILISTHDLDLAKELASDIIHIKNGQVTFHGNKKDGLNQSKIEKLYD